MKVQKLFKRTIRASVSAGNAQRRIFVAGSISLAILISVISALPQARVETAVTTNSGMNINRSSSVETWSGNAGDNDWTSNNNWAGAGGAGANDDLVFPNVDAFHGRSSFNDFATNTSFNSLTFTGGETVVTGNQMFLANGMTVDTPDSVGDPPWIQTNIVLGGSQTWSFVSFITSISGVVNLNNHNLTVNTTDAGGGVSLSGLLNGTGTIDKIGSGTLFIEGDGNGFGTTTIDAGAVQVDGELGDVNLSGGTLRGTGDVDAISGSGTIAPGTGGNTSTAILTAHGNVTMSAGTTFAVNINGTTPGTDFDRLTVPGGNISLGGATLTGTLGPTVPTIGQTFIILQATGGHTLSGQFAQGNSIAIFGRLFSITYNSTNVTLTAQRTTRTWDGDLGNFWSFAQNWDGNFLPKGNMGDNLIFPAGASNVQHHADFPDGTSFNSLTFTGNGYNVDGNDLALTGGISENAPAGDGSTVLVDIQLAQAQSFSANGLGTVANGNGMVYASPHTIDLNGFALTMSGTGRQLFQGPITGAGGIVKDGTGGATLSGTNTFTGGTQVNAGTLVVSGTTPGTVTLNGGTIGGSGTVGPITGSGGISPGAITGTGNFIFAILNANGNVGLSSGSTFVEEIGGPTAGTEYDRLNVTGTVNLGAGVNNLTGTLFNGFVPVPGQQFTIIQSTGGVTGTFAQGNTITFGGTLFSITYTANSVILTAQAPTAAGVEVSGRVLVSAQGRGLRNAIVTLVDSQGVARTVATGSQGSFKFEDVPTGETYVVRVRSKRLNYVPRILQLFDTVTDFDFTPQQ